jgi:hypothetical protein
MYPPIYTLLAYNVVKALFVELPAFERYRARYLDDDAFTDLQTLLMSQPDAGDVIPGTVGYANFALLIQAGGKESVVA